MATDFFQLLSIIGNAWNGRSGRDMASVKGFAKGVGKVASSPYTGARGVVRKVRGGDEPPQMTPIAQQFARYGTQYNTLRHQALESLRNAYAKVQIQYQALMEERAIEYKKYTGDIRFEKHLEQIDKVMLREIDIAAGLDKGVKAALAKFRSSKKKPERDALRDAIKAYIKEASAYEKEVDALLTLIKGHVAALGVDMRTHDTVIKQLHTDMSAMAAAAKMLPGNVAVDAASLRDDITHIDTLIASINGIATHLVEHERVLGEMKSIHETKFKPLEANILKEIQKMEPKTKSLMDERVKIKTLLADLRRP